ncbi:MAG: hypothetical protein WCK78_06470 [Paludibacter sp.]
MRRIFTYFVLTIIASICTTIQVIANDYLRGDIMQPWEGGPAYFAKWKNGPSTDATKFPIAVWYQQPRKAAAFKAIGINLFIYISKNEDITPIAEQKMTVLPLAGQSSLSNITGQNAASITAWVLPKDEPDNSVEATGTSVPIAEVISSYNQQVKADPTRPVFLSLGSGVASADWWGRGKRCGHSEDYYEYTKAGDWLSMDIYPMNLYRDSTLKEWKQPFLKAAAENIAIIGTGIDNLRRYSGSKKPVLAWLECTNYERDARCKLGPKHIKPEAWIAIIHGARAIGYFCHIISKPVVEAAVLKDSAMMSAIAVNNALIQSQACVLNTQTVKNAATVTSTNFAVPVSFMAKRYKRNTYIYAVAEQAGSTNATFQLRAFKGNATVEVVGENRSIKSKNGVFNDSFRNFDVHIYKLKTSK